METLISRRNFLKTRGIALGTVAVCSSGLGHVFAEGQAKSSVFFTKDISSNGLLSISAKLGRALPGKVAVKLHSGEPGGHHFLVPDLIKGLVQSVNGTIVECNTAYPGKRFKTEDHKQALEDHGFAAIAPVDVMDAEGSISLPFPNGKNITESVARSARPPVRST